jgi:hypothetical protein
MQHLLALKKYPAPEPSSMPFLVKHLKHISESITKLSILPTPQK